MHSAGRQIGSGIVAALALMTLAAVTVPPYVTKALLLLRAEGTANDIAAALVQAHDEAIRTKRPVRVTFDERDRSWQLDDEAAGRVPRGIGIAGPKPDHDGIEAIIFFPDGSSSGGQVVVSSPSHAWSLAVDLLTGGLRRTRAGPA
jgi:general secretion pathway protein H